MCQGIAVGVVYARIYVFRIPVSNLHSCFMHFICLRCAVSLSDHRNTDMFGWHAVFSFQSFSNNELLKIPSSTHTSVTHTH